MRSAMTLILRISFVPRASYRICLLRGDFRGSVPDTFGAVDAAGGSEKPAGAGKSEGEHA